MLNKAPKLKSTVKMKMKSNMNMRPTSEAMVTYSTILNPEMNFFVLFMPNALLFSQLELLTLLFLNSLAEEAKAKAFEEKSATIRAKHLKAVSKVSYPKRRKLHLSTITIKCQLQITPFLNSHTKRI